MDPLVFEELVADLFRAMGMRAVTTQRSGDGGIDVDAIDPTPIRGGKILVQVKRYRRTVPPTAVRDLYGTVQAAGANKGVLVTTSDFGPGSRDFAQNKPLELISGNELVDLLHRHGMSGRLGGGAEPRPETGTGRSERTERGVHQVIGLSWAAGPDVDLCALVCRQGRVLSDRHLVFFNNEASPGGSVRLVAAPTPADRAGLEIAFDALPPEVDEIMLAAAVDQGTAEDLCGFADVRLSLMDAARNRREEIGLPAGRRHEKAKILGSFRREGGDHWRFEGNGRGYHGGLRDLVRERGVHVD
jgi:restriction system protein